MHKGTGRRGRAAARKIKGNGVADRIILARTGQGDAGHHSAGDIGNGRGPETRAAGGDTRHERSPEVSAAAAAGNRQRAAGRINALARRRHHVRRIGHRVALRIHHQPAVINIHAVGRIVDESEASRPGGLQRATVEVHHRIAARDGVFVDPPGGGKLKRAAVQIQGIRRGAGIVHLNAHRAAGRKQGVAARFRADVQGIGGRAGVPENDVIAAAVIAQKSPARKRRHPHRGRATVGPDDKIAGHGASAAGLQIVAQTAGLITNAHPGAAVKVKRSAGKHISTVPAITQLRITATGHIERAGSLINDASAAGRGPIATHADRPAITYRAGAARVQHRLVARGNPQVQAAAAG